MKYIHSIVFIVFMGICSLENLQSAIQLPIEQSLSSDRGIFYVGVTGDLINELFGNQRLKESFGSLNIEKIRSLLDFGADVTIVNEHGLTLFMAVIISDRIELKKKEQIVQVMLSNARSLRAFLEHKDEEGKTAFWYAAEQQYVDIMFLLERNGALKDVQVLCKNRQGVETLMTPFEYACYYDLEKTRTFYFSLRREQKEQSTLVGLKAVISWETVSSAVSSPRSACSSVAGFPLYCGT